MHSGLKKGGVDFISTTLKFFKNVNFEVFDFSNVCSYIKLAGFGRMSYGCDSEDTGIG